MKRENHLREGDRVEERFLNKGNSMCKGPEA